MAENTLLPPNVFGMQKQTPKTPGTIWKRLRYRLLYRRISNGGH